MCVCVCVFMAGGRCLNLTAASSRAVFASLRALFHSVIVVQLTTDNDRSKRSEVEVEFSGLGLGFEAFGLGLVFLALAVLKAKVKVTNILPNTVYLGINYTNSTLVYQHHRYHHSASPSTVWYYSVISLRVRDARHFLSGLGLGLETTGLVNIPCRIIVLVYGRQGRGGSGGRKGGVCPVFPEPTCRP